MSGYDTGHVFARLFGGSLDLEPEDQEAETLRAAQRRAKEEGAEMIDDREVCVCGHPRSEHDHRVAECTACDDCPMFADRT